MSLGKRLFAGGALSARVLSTIMITALVTVPSAALSQPRWVPDGRVLCAADNGQIATAIVTDGSGGSTIARQGYGEGTEFPSRPAYTSTSSPSMVRLEPAGWRS